MPTSRQVRKSHYSTPRLSPSTSVSRCGCGLRSLDFFQVFGARRRKNGLRSLGSQNPVTSLSSSFSASAQKVILLPTEIVAKIFLCFTSDPLEPSHKFNLKPFDESVKQPLILSHVCKHWRYVALGTPILWSSIYISRDLHPNLLHLFLRRTQGFPLALYIDGSHYLHQFSDSTVAQPHSLYLFQRALPTNEQSRIVQCLVLIRKEFYRCVTMDATLDTMSAFACMDMLSSALGPQSNVHRQSGALKLTKVAVRMTDRTSSSALVLYRVLDCLHTMALSTPSLQTLHWESARPLSVQKDLILHPIWSQLKTIRIHTKMSSRDCVLLLRVCRAATDVTVCGITPSKHSPHFRQRKSYIPGGQHVTVLSNLRSLSLRQAPGASSSCVRVVQHFTLPSLRFLGIHTFQATDQSCKILEEMLCRSFTAETICRSRSILNASGGNDASILRLLCIPPLLRDRISYTIQEGSLSLYFRGIFNPLS